MVDSSPSQYAYSSQPIGTSSYVSKSAEEVFGLKNPYKNVGQGQQSIAPQRQSPATITTPSYNAKTGTYTSSTGQGFSMAAPPTTTTTRSSGGGGRSSTPVQTVIGALPMGNVLSPAITAFSQTPIGGRIQGALTTMPQTFLNLPGVRQEIDQARAIQNAVQSTAQTLGRGLTEGYSGGYQMSKVSPYADASESMMPKQLTGGTYTAAKPVDPIYSFGSRIGEPIGRTIGSFWKPGTQTGEQLRSDRPSEAIPAFIGSMANIPAFAWAGPEAAVKSVQGVAAVKRGYDIAKLSALERTGAFLKESSVARPVVEFLEKPWLAESSPKLGRFLKTTTTYIPENILLTEAFAQGNIAAVKDYSKDKAFMEEVSMARQKTVYDQGKVGAFFESAPGINIPYGAIKGTTKEFRENMVNDMRDKGIYTEAEIQARADQGVKFIQRMKPLEFTAMVLPSSLIEGGGREAYNLVYKDLAKKGAMLPSEAVSAVAGGSNRWVQNFLVPKGKAFLTTAPLGVVEGIGQDYASQRFQQGDKLFGFTGMKTKLSEFLKPTSGSQQLNVEDSSKLYSEIQSQGRTGTKVKVPNTLTETNPLTGEQKVTQRTIDATKYRIDKDGTIYNVFVDDTGKVIGGSSTEVLSQKYDPFRGAFSGIIGGYSSGAMQKAIMTRQIKDLPIYYGGEIKDFGKGPLLRLQGAAESGKFTKRDFSPFFKAADDTKGTVTFGTSTSSDGGQMVGLSPSGWRQRLAYLTDWTEKPGDVAQNTFRNLRRALGREVTEPTMSYKGTVIPVKPRVSTSTLGTTAAGTIASGTTGTGTSGVSWTYTFPTDISALDTSGVDMSVSPEQWARTKTYTKTMPMNVDTSRIGLNVPQVQTPGQIIDTSSNVGTPSNIYNIINSEIPSFTETNLPSETTTTVTTPSQTITETTTTKIDTFVPTFTDIFTDTNTQTTTNLPTETNTMTNTFQKFELPLAMWPGLGGLGGAEAQSERQGKYTSGVNVNYLRNFFFDKVKNEALTPLQRQRIMLSGQVTPQKVRSTSDKLSSLLGISNTKSIVSNSAPFPQKMPKKVKTKKTTIPSGTMPSMSANMKRMMT